MPENTGVTKEQHTREPQVKEKKVPQEVMSMRAFCTAVEDGKNNGTAPLPFAKVEELFQLDWLRKTSAKDERGIIDTENGWVRERVEPSGVTMRIAIQPEHPTEQGDMRLVYIDHRGNQGDAAQELITLDSTIPNDPHRMVEISLFPNNKYKFKVVPITGEADVLRGSVEELVEQTELGEAVNTVWKFD